ncbi:MAG TPA: 5'-nucleotidase, lipoprotein e(P4) family [Dongiaceae bacterium]|nr:5'-nucleotidase, lipoprotein e(P4) family [Dongiaceae bacterium]
MTSFRLRPLLAFAACLALSPLGGALAQDAPANDTLNAVLWMQRSVEYKANALGAFALAQIRLDQALADKNWTAAPAEQTGAYQGLPPAVILDADETILDNSGYQAWLITAGESFNPKTWTQFVKSETSTPIPGAVEFTKYADSKGVKVFYISNRTKEEEDPTREVMTKYGFPMGGNVDTFLSAKEQPDWGSAKGTRRAVVAKDYRVLLLVGDNFGDFSDAYKGTEDERLASYEADKARWGHDWIMLPNPAYGSFESAPFKHDFKVPAAEQRAAKRGALTPWDGK